ncbi:type IV pilus assembly protein PilW [Variovorax boronicumulans]|uniref:PilW family protein n=1 Tax=Variovorax boronicumulans TaxID=436515 RepID=UPI0027840028|nr:PilW family protein [Variovorax boronicumulans]MDP9914702.1 type IV pilus assembly protein PilW [Variovorax boronicumulans]
MKSTSARRFATASQRGFTLIELMVGLVLGLLTVLVITQVLSLAEGKRRAITMGGDAQINGSLSIFSLQRDIQQAGYGAAASPDALGCPVKRKFDASGTAATFTLAPVVITDGGNSGAPDTITILQSNTPNFSTPMLLTGNHAQTDDHFTVSSSLNASVGNLMIAVPKTQSTDVGCALFSVTSNTSAATTTLSGTNVPHVAGAGALTKWNQSAVFPTAGYEAGSYLLNMGSMVLRTYSISGLSLKTDDFTPTSEAVTASVLYPQIVNLQAFYGKDTNGDGIVDTYDTVLPTTSAGWMQVLAVRIAVVARSNQYEKEPVTTEAPKWDVGATSTFTGLTPSTCHGTSKCLPLKIDHVTEWEHYRYKVYDTIVPLRNVIWNS